MTKTDKQLKTVITTDNLDDFVLDGVVIEIPYKLNADDDSRKSAQQDAKQKGIDTNDGSGMFRGVFGAAGPIPLRGELTRALGDHKIKWARGMRVKPLAAWPAKGSLVTVEITGDKKVRIKISSDSVVGEIAAALKSGKLSQADVDDIFRRMKEQGLTTL